MDQQAQCSMRCHNPTGEPRTPDRSANAFNTRRMPHQLPTLGNRAVAMSTKGQIEMSEDRQTLLPDDCLARLLMIADIVIEEFKPPSSLNGFIINAERILDQNARGQKISPLRDAVVGIAFETGALTIREINLHVLGRTTYRNKAAIQQCLVKRRQDVDFSMCYARARSHVIAVLQDASTEDGAEDDSTNTP